MCRPEGEQHGCTDTGAPEKYTAATLSRVLDLIDAAIGIENAGEKNFTKIVWDTIPYDLKMEFNFANWKYTSTKYSKGE